jgi:thiamine-phosphate pyrophosphorylase
MSQKTTDDLPNCRLFLMPPSGMDADTVSACVGAASGAGDIACLALPSDKALLEKIMPMAQSKDIAVLIIDDPRTAAYEKADGAHITSGLEDAIAARKSLGRNASVGFVASGSRHAAMEAGETEIDYIAFDLSAPAGADLLEWWTPLFKVQCVGINAPDEAACLAAIEAGADFVSPPDAFWSSPETAAGMAARLTKAGQRSTA